jgi:hypothetical protein
MKTRLIGDIHGMVYEYKAYAIDNFEGPTIQVGDFGVGFGQGDYWVESVNHYHKMGGHRFIRGNHDNLSVCKTMPGWIQDGRVENDVMFIGGAWSIDNPNAPSGWHKRTAGYNWWDDEECTDAQFEIFRATYAAVRPRVMITHDCPHEIASHMFWDTGYLNGPRYNTRTGDFLQSLLEIHQPEFHFFGHWHKTMSYQYGNTLYQCIGELDFIDVDLGDSDQMNEAIIAKHMSVR